MELKFIDLFAGIGGFRIAAEQAAKELGIQSKCVFSSEIDVHAQKTYAANFGETPAGDITKIPADEIPDHDLLLAGFPCQPFSIIGQRKGFEDTRGTLFFEIARILEAKRPRTFVLENVKQLVTHQKGYTFQRIQEALRDLDYVIDHRVLNSLDYGLPQKRERVYIVGFYKPAFPEGTSYKWPPKQEHYRPLSEILEKEVEERFFVSDRIKEKRLQKHVSSHNLAIWHENKAGNVTSYPYSCALRANASYNYLLVNGVRRLTGREMLRLQGFPDDFRIVVSYAQIRKQAGNAVSVNVARAVIRNLLPILINAHRREHEQKQDAAAAFRKKVTTAAAIPVE